MKNLKLLKDKYATLSNQGKALVWLAGIVLLLLVIGGCK